MPKNSELVLYYGQKAALAAASKALAPVFFRMQPGLFGRPEPEHATIERALARLPGLELDEYVVDVHRFREWVTAGGYPTLAYLVNREEKLLEHFVSVDLLGNPHGGLLVDVASCRSHFPDIMRRRGMRVLAQDLSYTEGLRGDFLGGDAASMALADASVDAMTLHCSFEHFEGTADSRFVAEAARVLAPGGRAVVLPLYLSHEFVIETDPVLTGGRIEPDDGARIALSPGYVNRHGRHYDAAHFERRVLREAIKNGLHCRVFFIRGATEISSACYLRYALVLSK